MARILWTDMDLRLSFLFSFDLILFFNIWTWLKLISLSTIVLKLHDKSEFVQLRFALFYWVSNLHRKHLRSCKMPHICWEMKVLTPPKKFNSPVRFLPGVPVHLVKVPLEGLPLSIRVKAVGETKGHKQQKALHLQAMKISFVRFLKTCGYLSISATVYMCVWWVHTKNYSSVHKASEARRESLVTHQQ